MSKYDELKRNPPKIKIKEDAREVIFETISCMCDNKDRIRFKKDSDGYFKMSGMGSSLKNWGMKHHHTDIEWTADEEKWKEVISMINSGTSKVSSAKSR